MNLSQLSSLEFGGLPGAVPCARMHARQVFAERGLNELAETAELLVSELVTNAVQASLATGDLLGIRQRLYAGRPGQRPTAAGADGSGPAVVAEVWDLCPEPPLPKASGPASENGRGLQLVEALAAEWGWYEPPGWPGTAVWCLILAPA